MFNQAHADGGGEIDGDEFATWLRTIEDLDPKEIVQTGAKAAARVVEKLKEKTAERVEQLGWGKLFEDIDTDGSDELDAEEFNAALRKQGLPASEVSDTELREIFNLIDSDGSGSLSSAEFVAALRKTDATGYTMTFQAFESSMLELADYWSKGVKEETYTHFFQTLFRAITEPLPGVTDSPMAVVNSEGKANYRLRDSKYIGSLVNAGGKFDGGLLVSPRAAADQNDPNANACAGMRQGMRGPHISQRPHISSDDGAANKKLPLKPTLPTVVREKTAATTNGGKGQPTQPAQDGMRGESDNGGSSARLGQGLPSKPLNPNGSRFLLEPVGRPRTTESRDAHVWRSGLLKGDYVLGGQSLGPSVEDAREIFDHRPHTAQEDEWTFRQTQGYVSVAATARGESRRRTYRGAPAHHSAPSLTTRPSTSSCAGYGLPTSSDYGLMRDSKRRTKPRAPLTRLRPWPPLREVTFVEGPMVAGRGVVRGSHGVVRGSAGRASDWKGFWLGPAMRATE